MTSLGNTYQRNLLKERQESFQKTWRCFLDSFGGLFAREISKAIPYLDNKGKLTLCFQSENTFEYVKERCNLLKNATEKYFYGVDFLVFEFDQIKYERLTKNAPSISSKISTEDRFIYLLSNLDSINNQSGSIFCGKPQVVIETIKAPVVPPPKVHNLDFKA